MSFQSLLLIDFEGTDSYAIEVAPTENLALMVGAVIIIDHEV